MYSMLGDSININKTCRMYGSMEMYTVKIEKRLAPGMIPLNYLVPLLGPV